MGVRGEGGERGAQLGRGVQVGEGEPQAGDRVERPVEAEVAHVADAEVQAGPYPPGAGDHAGLGVHADDREPFGEVLQVVAGAAADIQQGARAGRPVGVDQGLDDPGLGVAGVGVQLVVQLRVPVGDVRRLKIPCHCPSFSFSSRLRSPTSSAIVSYSGSGTSSAVVTSLRFRRPRIAITHEASAVRLLRPIEGPDHLAGRCRAGHTVVVFLPCRVCVPCCADRRDGRHDVR